MCLVAVLAVDSINSHIARLTLNYMKFTNSQFAQYCEVQSIIIEVIRCNVQFNWLLVFSL